MYNRTRRGDGAYSRTNVIKVEIGRTAETPELNTRPSFSFVSVYNLDFVLFPHPVFVRIIIFVFVRVSDLDFRLLQNTAFVRLRGVYEQITGIFVFLNTFIRPH